MKAVPKRERHFALRDFLHPAQAFRHPSKVVRDPDLTVNEKRAILTSWASDASTPITLDAVLKALRALDLRTDPAASSNLRNWKRRQARRQAIERFRNRRGSGFPLPRE
jgi:hypothetical protein